MEITTLNDYLSQNYDELEYLNKGGIEPRQEYQEIVERGITYDNL